MNIAGKGLVSGIHQEFLYKPVRNSFLKMHKGFWRGSSQRENKND